MARAAEGRPCPKRCFCAAKPFAASTLMLAIDAHVARAVEGKEPQPLRKKVFCKSQPAKVNPLSLGNHDSRKLWLDAAAGPGKRGGEFVKHQQSWVRTATQPLCSHLLENGPSGVLALAT
eukprot:357277-Chlamydomonas_euryale.AAC.7